MRSKSYFFVFVVVVLAFLVACGGGGGAAVEETESNVDPDTGLLINPESDPGEPFIVEGTVSSLNLTPQTSPEFVVRAPSGKTYRIRSQALSETFFEDGESVVPSQLRQGAPIRATVTYDPDQLLYLSEDLVFLRPE